MNRARHQRGLSLLELIVVILIAGLLVAATVVTLRSVTGETTRTSARVMSASMRFAYDRARASGRDHRLVIDFDAKGGTSCALEVAGEGVRLMPATLDDAWKEHQKLSGDEDEDELEDELSATTIGGLNKELVAIKKHKKPVWKPFPWLRPESAKRLVKAGRFIQSVYVARLDTEVSEGKLALYAYGDGRLERVAIYMGRDEENIKYTLVTHPLTGRVKIHSGKVTLGKGDLDQDDAGETIEKKD